MTERPKYREVHAAAYWDRVVHHLLHALVEPSYERRFSPSSFACRRGKGTHAAVARHQEHMASLSQRGGGITAADAARLIQRALTQSHAVAVALEGLEGAGNVKQRRLAYLFEPLLPSTTPGETAL